jgi:uncharacterized protein (DUF2062 family)
MVKIKNIVKKILGSGLDAHTLALSFCIGLYIAFSPFPGLHLVMTVAATYLFKLHFPTVFIACSFNNPWTMIPFYSADYAFGYWLVHSFFGWSPAYVLSLKFLFGSGSICLISFLIGGNILGITIASLCYPLIKKGITKALIVRQNQPEETL